MAARRLVIVLALLLVVSTVAALLAPTPHRPQPGTTGSSTTTTSTATTTTATRRAAGRHVTRAVTFEAAARRPPRAHLRVGDQLALRVVSTAPDQVRVNGFGLLEAVSRDAPAHFDLFADRPGTFAVRLLDARRTVGRIVVRKR